MNKDVQEIIKLISAFFKNQPDKMGVWFFAENPLLGGITPYKMILLGKEAKLLKFVQNQIKDNAHET